MNNLTDYKTPHKIRVFNLEAISLPIVYNKYGDYDPNGLMYVLKEDSGKIQEKAKKYFKMTPPQPFADVQPLVIRANVGDEIHVNLYNKLDRKVSMHVQGLKYDVLSSDGANVGYNPDTGTDSRYHYVWYAEKEGVYLFSDMSDTRSSEEGTNVHGLFGAIIIEEAESTWLDPVTGVPLASGIFADVYHPVKPAFREYAVFFHDELEIKDKNGLNPTDPHTGLSSGTTGISYRSEPMRNRMPLTDPNHEEHVLTGEDISMSSWPYGDPAPPILRAYVGDPSKIRLVHGGIKETHVFHLHNHQWRLDPNNSQSTIIDSISISPQECYTLDILYGAGSLNGMIGDAIWHCHLYPHFNEGMWSLWRVFDKMEDGSGVYPDGTKIDALMPLKDRISPPLKSIMTPGFPNFINGEFGERPLQPPLGILTAAGENKIDPTPLEQANFVPAYAPGALYTQTCPCDTEENMKVFELALVQADIVYNSYGWHDPQGRFFVLKEDIEKYGTLKNYIKEIEKGNIKPEPLVIRANAGDCIEIRLTNLLPKYLEESAFQLKTLTDIAGYHIHLVKFDTIVADGGSNGWNNIAGAEQCETLIERFYANEELHTVFFHDHLSANSHQQHGVFAALVIEPAGSKYLDPKTGDELKSGTQAVIHTGTGEYYREFALFVHDFALLFDKNGNPLNPPEHPGSDDDPGVMGINYRAEPLRERLNAGDDPAYVFSSYIHSDPATPVLKTYPGEPMVIRLIDGAHEEQHAFNMTGLSWKKEITNPVSPMVQEQTIGISEAFNIKIDEYYSCGDYLYYFGGMDDLWLGLWGIIRAYKEPQEHLLPLCKGHQSPQPKTLTPPKDAIIRKYQIAAIQKDIKYNKYGDYDPEGLLFVPLDRVHDVMCSRKETIPLILRANAGDWIEITLYNMFDPKNPVKYNDYPSVPLDKLHTPSNRVSLNPQFLKYDPINSSGLNVGYNSIEQTVEPEKSIKYLWHADKEYGVCLINSFGDIRNHRHHGLFGAVIIEPPGAEYFNKDTAKPDIFGEQSVITAPGTENFREFVLFAQNGIRLLDKKGEIIKTTASDEEDDNGHGDEEHEDSGEKGYNYRSERFFNRLVKYPKISKIFNSKIHGDPSTPIFTAYTGERAVIRFAMPGDKPRNTSFLLHGHQWKAQPGNPFTRIIPIQGAVSAGNVFNIELENGASTYPGDYLYRSGSLKWDVESGMWGIFRVMARSIGCYCENIWHKTVCWCKDKFNKNK
ncbi:MAG: multicopper oxidase domain-containing protein [Eubacteriales bacterium]